MNNTNTTYKNVCVLDYTQAISHIDNERSQIISVLEKRREDTPYSRDVIIADNLNRLGLERKSVNYMLCGELVSKFHCERCGNVEFISRSSCNLRICEKCCKKLFYKLWSGYYPKVKLFKNAKLITLTFGPTPILRPEVITEYRKMFFKWRKRMKIPSGVYVFEVKRSPARIEDIEVHIHALVDSAFIPQQKTSEAWSEISGRRITDIRRAYGKRSGLGYIMKYVLKKPSFPIARDYACYEFMFDKKRRIQGFGICAKSQTSLVDMEITCSRCGSKMVKIEETSCWLLEQKLREQQKGIG